MTGLLDSVLEAHGGVARWGEFSTMEATMVSGASRAQRVATIGSSAHCEVAVDHRPRALEERPAAVRQLGDHLAARMPVVAVAIRQPYLAHHGGLDLVVVAPLRVRRDLDGPCTAASRLVQDVPDEGCLRFVDIEDRV